MRGRIFMKTIALTLALSLLPAISFANDITAEDLSPLIGEALTDTFKGVTMHGTYKHPRERTGTSAFTETFHENGTTSYREGKITDKGEWAVTGDTICFGYSGELSGGVSCFNVFKAGNCYYSYGLGQLRDGYPVRPNSWSAKTIIKGEYNTCDDLVS